jgi:hypothetical protein
MIDASRLKSILLKTGLVKDNHALYQVILALINGISELNTSSSSSSSSTITNIITGGGMGIPGIDGLDGEDGIIGPRGADGVSNTPGPIGPMGAIIFPPDAEDGDMFPPIVGPQGNPGPTGVQGPVGPHVIAEELYWEEPVFPIIAPIARNIAQTLETTVYTITGAFADITGLTVTITPKFGNSKFRITASVNIYLGNGLSAVSMRLMRNGASIQQYDTVGFNNNTQVTGETWMMDFIDTPATISALTYKIQAKNTQGGSVINNIINGPDLVVSSITVEEIYQ